MGSFLDQLTDGTFNGVDLLVYVLLGVLLVVWWLIPVWEDDEPEVIGRALNDAQAGEYVSVALDDATWEELFSNPPPPKPLPGPRRTPGGETLQYPTTIRMHMKLDSSGFVQAGQSLHDSINRMFGPRPYDWENEPSDARCFTRPDGECVAKGCELHHAEA